MGTSLFSPDSLLRGILLDLHLHASLSFLVDATFLSPIWLFFPPPWGYHPRPLGVFIPFALGSPRVAPFSHFFCIDVPFFILAYPQ